MAEQDSDGTTYRYLWGPERTPLALEVISPQGTSTFYDYRTDAAGSVVAITSGASADPVATYAYDAFGALLTTGGSDAALAKRNPLRYRAYYYDEATQLYYLPARYYEPSTARFLSPDPAPPSAGDPLSLNAYTYCQGDPVNASDPTGAITDYDGNGKVDTWDSSMSAAKHTSDWMYAAVFRSRALRAWDAHNRAADMRARRGMAQARVGMTLRAEEAEALDVTAGWLAGISAVTATVATIGGTVAIATAGLGLTGVGAAVPVLAGVVAAVAGGISLASGVGHSYITEKRMVHGDLPSNDWRGNLVLGSSSLESSGLGFGLSVAARSSSAAPGVGFFSTTVAWGIAAGEWNEF